MTFCEYGEQCLHGNLNTINLYVTSMAVYPLNGNSNTEFLSYMAIFYFELPGSGIKAYLLSLQFHGLNVQRQPCRDVHYLNSSRLEFSNA